MGAGVMWRLFPGNPLWAAVLGAGGSRPSLQAWAPAHPSSCAAAYTRCCRAAIWSIPHRRAGTAGRTSCQALLPAATWHGARLWPPCCRTMLFRRPAVGVGGRQPTLAPSRLATCEAGPAHPVLPCREQLAQDAPAAAGASAAARGGGAPAPHAWACALAPRGGVGVSSCMLAVTGKGASAVVLVDCFAARPSLLQGWR